MSDKTKWYCIKDKPCELKDECSHFIDVNKDTDMQEACESMDEFRNFLADTGKAIARDGFRRYIARALFNLSNAIVLNKVQISKTHMLAQMALFKAVPVKVQPICQLCSEKDSCTQESPETCELLKANRKAEGNGPS